MQAQINDLQNKNKRFEDQFHDYEDQIKKLKTQIHDDRQAITHSHNQSTTMKKKNVMMQLNYYIKSSKKMNLIFPN